MFAAFFYKLRKVVNGCVEIKLVGLIVENIMESSNEQASGIVEANLNNEQEHNDEGMEETEDYNFDGEEYRHYVPRGRSSFRCVVLVYSRINFFFLIFLFLVEVYLLNWDWVTIFFSKIVGQFFFV